MDTYRVELFPCVSLTAVRTDKFKTGYLSSTLLTQLCRETAADNAVLPYVLRRGTSTLPDMQAISARLDELYGASLEPCVRKLGEMQGVGFRMSFTEDRFLPGETHVFTDMAELLSDVWLSPNTRGGLLQPDYVDGERQKLLERMEAEKNDRAGWARRRLIENMCCFEDYALSELGDPAEAEGIHYVSLTKRYRALLSTAPMEFFYCGSLDGAEVARVLRDAFFRLPRGEIDLELGTDIRMNSVEAEPRFFAEEMDVTQGSLCMGFRLGSCMEEPDEAAIRVFNALFGGCVTSRLFENIREKMSLCYYASSSLDMLKGVMLVSSGIAFDKYDAAREGILAQLQSLAAGDITAEELSAAKNYLSDALRSIPDNAAALENFILRQTVQGSDMSPDELAALVEDVTAEEAAAVAGGVELDAVYFLKGESEA